jgi:hypothetical protein
MEVYSYRMPWGEVLRIGADLVRAERSIYYQAGEEHGEPHWVPTPYQTADARHCAPEMLALVVAYLGAEWYAAPVELDATPEAIEARIERELRAAIDRAELLSVRPLGDVGDVDDDEGDAR